ncbi:MAG: type II toxin-antitoxin system death-on-curing family toxin [Candidatus Margulisiibacteriota bacterium]
MARIGGYTPAEALARLSSAGISVRDENDLIPKAAKKRAWEVLGIGYDQNILPLTPSLPEVEEEAQVEVEKAPRPQKSFPRSHVGHPAPHMVYMNPSEVEAIHWQLVRDFGKTRDPIIPPGVKDQNLLASALHRVHTSLGCELKYPTVPMAAAAYLHAIIGNHAFHNGNKRTALVATLVFLDLNGFLLEVDEDNLFDYLIQIADHKIVTRVNTEELADLEMWEIARWLHRNSRAVSHAERLLKFHELRSILNQYGCTFKTRTGNRMNISRGEFKTQVYYRNDGTDVDRGTIRKIRTDLHLSEEDGYDSTIFYNAEEKISDFMLKYRCTLDRLAKV